MKSELLRFDSDDDPEASADPAVLRLLRAGTPENGVDFVGWWEANLPRITAEGTAVAVAASEAPVRQTSCGLSLRWLAVAASLLVGVGVGAFGQKLVTPAAAHCKYTVSQLDSAIACIRANDGSGPSVDGATLASCSTCHDWKPTPKSGCNYTAVESAQFFEMLKSDRATEVANASFGRLMACASCHPLLQSARTVARNTR